MNKFHTFKLKPLAAAAMYEWILTAGSVLKSSHVPGTTPINCESWVQRRGLSTPWKGPKVYLCMTKGSILNDKYHYQQQLYVNLQPSN